MYNEKLLLEELKKLGIEYKYISHPAVFTSDQANEITPDFKGAHCKNLFVKDKTNQKWLLTIPDDKKTDLKHVATIIGSKRLSFCNADEMMECLGVTPGSVTPLAVINDTKHKVILYIDKTVMDWAIINCHPMINTATISISKDDFKTFIAFTNHDLNIAELT
jgi:Ala-tRNA(Pro) deacylase